MNTDLSLLLSFLFLQAGVNNRNKWRTKNDHDFSKDQGAVLVLTECMQTWQRKEI
jgi:hypothetical protein